MSDVLIAVVLVSAACLLCVFPPISAHSAAQMGIAPDQYDQGIPVYWPVHAGLMSAGFTVLVVGFVVMRYHKTSRWFRSHVFLQSAGGTLAIAGLVTSYSMVSLSGAPHFRYIHDILGIETVGAILVTLAVGLRAGRNRRAGIKTRAAHRWLGRAAIAMVALNIVLGIAMMGMVLAQ